MKYAAKIRNKNETTKKKTKNTMKMGGFSLAVSKKCLIFAAKLKPATHGADKNRNNES